MQRAQGGLEMCWNAAFLKLDCESTLYSPYFIHAVNLLMNNKYKTSKSLGPTLVRKSNPRRDESSSRHRGAGVGYGAPRQLVRVEPCVVVNASFIVVQESVSDGHLIYIYLNL